MGVRTYTLFVISLPSHSPAGRSSLSEGRPTGVVVDWSDLAPSVDGVQMNIDELISWVSNCPRKSSIRVYLPSVLHRASMYKLQKALITMGCTVTCRFRPA